MRILQAKPLTAEDFAPFGQVIQCAGARHYSINEGSTQRYHDLARIEAGPGGKVIVSIFRGQPRAFPLTVAMVERHPLGSQAFMPLQGRPYLVVVAETLDGPSARRGAPGRLHAFLARGEQGVNYSPGTWHFPLIAVEMQSDFLVIDRAGESANCEEHPLAEPVLLECPSAAPNDG